MSWAPATLSSMRVVYSYPASLRRRCTRFTSSRASPSWIRSSDSRGSTAAPYGLPTFQRLELLRGELGHGDCRARRLLAVALPQAAEVRLPLEADEVVIRARDLDALGVDLRGQDI